MSNNNNNKISSIQFRTGKWSANKLLSEANGW